MSERDIDIFSNIVYTWSRCHIFHEGVEKGYLLSSPYISKLGTNNLLHKICTLLSLKDGKVELVGSNKERSMTNQWSSYGQVIEQEGKKMKRDIMP